MPITAAQARDPSVAGPLGGLALSVVRTAAPMMVIRALKWYRDLARLGVHLPFFLVHDVGLLYGASKEQLDFGERPGTGATLGKVPRLLELQRVHRDVVTEIGKSGSQRERALRLSDD